jgi:nucleoid DNA-binding protein
LIPKSHKIFINPTAEETGFSKILVEDAVGFYYSELRRLLNEIDSISIKIDKLGTFKVKPKEIRRLRARLSTHLNALKDPETFNQMRIKKDLEDRLKKVERISKMIKEEYERKKQIKQNRNEQDKGNLEEQETDI